MTELCVLGIGSPFGDDQLGWEVVKLLQQKTSLAAYMSQRIRLTCCDRPGMNLLELMRNTTNVFLIDAMHTGAMPGTLHCFVDEEIEEMSNTLSTHSIGVADVIKMGKILHELPQHLVLYGIEMGDVGFQFKISEPMVQAITKLSLRIEHDMLTLLN